MLLVFDQFSYTAGHNGSIPELYYKINKEKLAEK